MSTKLDEFKEFVKKHPLIKQDVLNKKRTWQQLYEDYVILGEDAFTDNENPQVSTSSSDTKTAVKEVATKTSGTTEDLIKTVVGYVKKIDPDSVTKTVTSIQKVIELFGSFGAGAASTALAKKSTGDPLFDKRFDDWY